MQILPDSLLKKVENAIGRPLVSVADDTGFARALNQSIKEVRGALRDDASPRELRPRLRDDDTAGQTAVELALLAGAPYNPTPELLSPFAPGPVRLTEKESNALIDAMRAEGVSARALSAMRDAGRYPGGATADQLILAARNALEGSAPTLSRREEALLQSLTLKAAGSKGKAALFGDGTPRNTLGTLMEGLAQSPAPVTIGRDEMAALTKALRLPEGTSRALLDGFHGEESLTLTGREWNQVLGQARAQLDQNAADMDTLLNSLEKHIRPILRDASRREETERLAGMREDKSVSQARELIKDRATVAAPGREDRVDPDRQTRATPRRDEARAQNDDRDDTARQTRESDRTGRQAGEQAAGQARPRYEENEQFTPRDDRPSGQAERAGRAGRGEQGERPEQNARSGQTDARPASDGVNAASENGARAAAASAARGTEQADTRAAAQARPARDDMPGDSGREESAYSPDSDADSRNPETFAGTARSGAAGASGTANPETSSLYAAVAQGVDTVVPQAGPQTNPDAGGVHNGTARATLPAQTLEQISEAVLTASRNGTQRLELALSPGDLGSMTVVLTTRHGEVSALIQPERAETAALIAEQVEQIRAQLENQGFKVDKVDVQTQLNDQQNPDWQGAEQHNASRDLAAQVEHLERLRRLSHASSSATGADLSGETSPLARDMHLQTRQATLAGHGLHIVA